MEVGAHVWLRSDSSHWGWVPALLSRKEEVTVGGLPFINLTLTDDHYFEGNVSNDQRRARDTSPASDDRGLHRQASGYYAEQDSFEFIITVDPEHLKAADHDDIKLRNLPTSFQLSGEDPEAGVIASPTTKIDESVVGGVDDLIGLTHLHEPAILHALRLRYDSDIIYTSTGPILIAVNPFKPMALYSEETMERYRIQGETGVGATDSNPMHQTPFKRRTNSAILQDSQQKNSVKRLPPHAYQTADDAYRAMIRGLENTMLMKNRGKGAQAGRELLSPAVDNMPTNQSILVSGESGAGKTVTTKIVLNYFAMLSKKVMEQQMNSSLNSSFLSSPQKGARGGDRSFFEDEVSIEQQVLQSNPILESFGNARTIRNDNSSRFGKYIDIRFTPSGKLSGASIETYLLEKVRLIHPSAGERNYHVFYQFLSSATRTERDQFYLDDMAVEDFRLLSQTATYDRRDGVSDDVNHQEMLDAMITIGFAPETIQSLMRLIVAVLFAGNMTFTSYHDDTCILNENEASLAAASLLGVSFEALAAAITSRTINAGIEVLQKQLSVEQATKACEAMIKAVYGAAFDFIVERVNVSIDESTNGTAGKARSVASIGVLDIFGFESFDSNNFEQICINYTNEALQQQFNKYVFKLEQKEYEKEGILWKFISFPDNQDVIDLIDVKHTGILALLDEQCIVPQSTDRKFTRYLYSRCDKHKRFCASSAQRVDYKFSIDHYAGPVEYTTDGWLEKNKDQLPAASAELLLSSSFKLLSQLRKYVRTDSRKGRGSVATSSVGAQFASQLRTLRARIDTTTPHYIRCLKPNDELVPDYFEPKNIVDQLRCGGVLEAVRVSRAGYPTRYPHEVFLARYYILGDSFDRTPMSPISGLHFKTDKEVKLKRLIAKIAFDVWEADHQMILHLLEAEKLQNELKSPKFAIKKAPVAVYTRGSTIINGPASLAVQSSAMTPPEKRITMKKKNQNRVSLTASIRERAEHGQNIARPESEEEYLSLDFGSRCAVAGLQLGKTKVFLRREAFDRIEAMRSQKFFGSAMTIQAMVRGKMYRNRFLQMKVAAIKIQALGRMIVCSNLIIHMKLDGAAIKIQSCWRMASARWSVFKCYIEMRGAAIIIQRMMRRFFHIQNRRKMYEIPASIKIQALVRGVKARNAYFIALYGVIRLQALYRGKISRSLSLKKTTEFSRNRTIAAESKMNAVKRGGNQTSNFSTEAQSVPFSGDQVVSSKQSDLYTEIQDENWAMVETILDKNPELAEEVDPSSGELPLHIIARHSNAWTLLIDMVLVLFPKALIHRDKMGALPIHHAAAHDNLAALEIIYSAYKEGINDIDLKGRLPVHVAAEFDAVDAVKFLLSKSPEGAFTMVHRPPDGNGGGLPLHIACRNYASIGVITALLAENFASAKRCDENGDLPIHLLLRCGEVVDQVVVKTLLTCFSSAVSRTDMNGDLPLAIAIKQQCKSAVVNTLLLQFPNAASVLNGEEHSALFLAFQHNADDRTILGLLNHAPELATAVDKRTGLLPIQVATEHEHSHFIVHNLLKRDMPIDLKEKIRAQLLPHHYSWNHVVSNTDDMYHQVVSKVLQQCTQPQVLALAHVEGPDGKIALASATPVCKHELRVMLRLFNTLEVVNQRPAYMNPINDTQIYYALRYEPPPNQSGAFTVLHEDKKDRALGDYVEDWDDTSVVSGVSRQSIRSTMSSKSQQSIDEKLRFIRKEKGQQVIAKLTSRSDVVERELKVRKEYHLSRHYVPAVISVHHTVQHAAYSEAMAEPGYCITMEGADTTAENLMLDMRRSGKQFPAKALKRIGISLLHMHEHGIVHCDFGTHNIGKFGSRWKLLGVGGSVPIGKPTDPNRGFYHPPESIVVESKRASLGKKSLSACVVSIPASSTYDIWAFGIVLYEAVAGVPLSPYACRGKRAMSSSEVVKIGRWDSHSLAKALRHLDSEDTHAKDLVSRLLHQDPDRRINTMRDVLEHSFFAGSSSAGDKQLPAKQAADDASVCQGSPGSQAAMSRSSRTTTRSHSNKIIKPSESTKSLPVNDMVASQRSAAGSARYEAPALTSQQKSVVNTSKQDIRHVQSDGPALDRENLVNGVSRSRDSADGKERVLDGVAPPDEQQSYSPANTKSGKSWALKYSLRSRMKPKPI